MQTTSTNTAHLIERKDASLNPMTRIVRTDSAVDAQGFAQILQAFDTGADSKQPEAAKEIEPREQAAAADADEQGEIKEDSGEIEDQSASDSSSSEQPTSDTDDQAQSDSQPTSDETGGANTGETNPSNADASSTPAQPDAGEQPKTTQSHDAQPAQADPGQAPISGEVAKPSEQPTPAQETTMRLLDQQSEQAKLTIKGVARSLTHAADVSVSSQAVDTRLGQGESSVPMIKEQAPAPQPAPQPTSQPQSPPQGPLHDQGSTPPDPARTTSMPNGPTHLNTPEPTTKPIDAQIDQSNTNAQQARSQRAESAIGVVPSNTKPNPATQAPSAGTLQAVGLGKQSSAQTVRAVSSVDAGLIGKDQRNPQPGSLAEKMKGASLPNQANRASVLAQVQRGLASMLRSGNNEMTLKLTPGHLGSLKIQLKGEGSKLQVRFETTNAHASEHLSESIKDLGAHLRTKGINLDKIEIQQQPSQGSETNTAGEHSQSDSSSHQGTDPRQSSTQNPEQSPQDQAFDDGDSIGDEPESIWTELGLDATA